MVGNVLSQTSCLRRGSLWSGLQANPEGWGGWGGAPLWLLPKNTYGVGIGLREQFLASVFCS